MHTDATLYNSDEPNAHLEYFIPTDPENLDGWKIDEGRVMCPLHANVVEAVDTPALSPGA